MGIFDKLKKKTDEGAVADSIAEASVNYTEGKEESTPCEGREEAGNEDGKAMADNGRRFTLVVEEIFLLQDNKGITVAGNLHGKLKVGDAVFIMHPNGQVTATAINGIEVNNGVSAEEAENQPVRIGLSDIQDKTLLKKYSVLTSIRPQHVINVNQPVENGQLLGLSMEFHRFNKDSEYMSLFVYVVCHAHFISPIYISKKPKENEDGTVTFTEESTFSFLSLTPPTDKGKKHLPVFTDGIALQKWEGVFNEEHPPKNMILRFPDVVSVSSNNMDGVVINPFGPVPVVLTKDYIEKITSLDGYKTEFEKKEKTNAQRVKVEQDTKIVLGVPTENEEVKQIREAIIETVTPNANVVKVYLLLKVDSNQEKTYFLVVDCDKDTEAETFNMIGAAAKPYLKQTKCMEMISYEQFGDRIHNMKGHGLIFDRATFWK